MAAGAASGRGPGPEWTRLLAILRRSLDRSGGSLDGYVTLSAPTEAERRLISLITGVRRSVTAARLKVGRAEADAYLRREFGRGIAEIVAEVALPIPRQRPGERRREEVGRAALASAAGRSRHAGQQWFTKWLALLSASPAATEIVRSGGRLSRAISVLDALPANDEMASTFAARVVGDATALRDASLREIVQWAIALRDGVELAATPDEERERWESSGVVFDDAASQVLVLNVRARGGIVADHFARAALIGMPIRVSMEQLRSADLVIDAPELFVTGDPGVLRAAAASGSVAPPMICTEGAPSAACRRLLTSARDTVFWWHTDFDWPGLRLLTQALERYPTARPWRMGMADYRAALVAGGIAPAGGPLAGAPAPTPWDPGLSAELVRAGRAVPEAAVVPTLLRDLVRTPAAATGYA